MDFLKSHDYGSTYLWNIHELHSAAHLYKKYGVVLTEEKESDQFFKNVWE